MTHRRGDARKAEFVQAETGADDYPGFKTTTFRNGRPATEACLTAAQRRPEIRLVAGPPPAFAILNQAIKGLAAMSPGAWAIASFRADGGQDASALADGG